MEKRTQGLETVLSVRKVQRAGDRIRAIPRGDSEPHRGQGGDRVCVLGIKTNQQCAQSGKPIHFFYLKPQEIFKFH